MSATRVLPSILVAVAVGLAIAGPIQVPPHYYAFADHSTHWGIPHFGDVVSNAAFLIPGILGFYVALRSPALAGRPTLKTAFATFFAGVIVVAFGSAYFHLLPGPETVTPDRIPIAIAAAAAFAIFAIDRLGLNERVSATLFVGAIVVAIIGLWDVTTTGDIRIYAFTQLAPVLVGAYLAWRPQNERPMISASRIWAMIGLYAAAKGVEILDHEIADILVIVTGHNLKHLLAAGAAACLIPPRR